MSYWVAGAAIGSAIIGAVSSKDASKQAAKGQAKGLEASKSVTSQATRQANDFFNIGQRSSQAGFQGALDFFKNSQPAKYQPMIQGNVAAQRAVGQGAIQANNAILGLPVDMSFANQPQAFNVDYAAVQNAQLPVLGARPPELAAEQAQQDEAQAGKAPSTMDKLTLGGYVADPREAFNPKNMLGNPLATLGVGKKITDKVDPIKNTKKLLGKLF